MIPIYTARPRIGFQLSMPFSLSHTRFFSMKHFFLLADFMSCDTTYEWWTKKNRILFSLASKHGCDCMFIGFNANFITLWSRHLPKVLSKYFILHAILNRICVSKWHHESHDHVSNRRTETEDVKKKPRIVVQKKCGIWLMGLRQWWRKMC